jgi:chemotaxis protein CheZ
MAVADPRELDRIVSMLKEARGSEVALADVIALAEVTTESLRTLFASINTALCRELHDIADYIGRMKGEIGALQANELKNSRIPAAGQELGAIVNATEAATHTIMECAEAVMSADASDAEAYKAFVDARMMQVFEACSFQDITGQRIAKVVETLQHIERRVARFADATGAKDAAGFANESERSEAERKIRLLLNGPSLDGSGSAQAEVDQLFT